MGGPEHSDFKCTRTPFAIDFPLPVLFFNLKLFLCERAEVRYQRHFRIDIVRKIVAALIVILQRFLMELIKQLTKLCKYLVNTKLVGLAAISPVQYIV